MSSLRTTPESLKLRVWSKSLASKYCFAMYWYSLCSFLKMDDSGKPTPSNDTLTASLPERLTKYFDGCDAIKVSTIHYNCIRCVPRGKGHKKKEMRVEKGHKIAQVVQRDRHREGKEKGKK